MKQLHPLMEERLAKLTPEDIERTKNAPASTTIEERLGFVELADVLERGDDTKKRIVTLLSQAMNTPNGIPATEVLQDESVAQMSAVYGLTTAGLLRWGEGTFKETDRGRAFVNRLDHIGQRSHSREYHCVDISEAVMGQM